MLKKTLQFNGLKWCIKFACFSYTLFTGTVTHSCVSTLKRKERKMARQKRLTKIIKQLLTILYKPQVQT